MTGQYCVCVCVSKVMACRPRGSPAARPRRVLALCTCKHYHKGHGLVYIQIESFVLAIQSEPIKAASRGPPGYFGGSEFFSLYFTFISSSSPPRYT